MESKEQNKQTNKIGIDTETEDRLVAARGEGGWGTGWEGEGIKKYKWLLKNSHGDIKAQHREYSQ